MELGPLLKKVERKRLVRGAAFRRRNEMALRILEQYTSETFVPYRSRAVWGQCSRRTAPASSRTRRGWSPAASTPAAPLPACSTSPTRTPSGNAGATKSGKRAARGRRKAAQPGGLGGSPQNHLFPGG